MRCILNFAAAALSVALLSGCATAQGGTDVGDHDGAAVVRVAEGYLGRAKFTPYPGPWCADAVSAWLRLAGKRPLNGRMASSALSYGPLTDTPGRGDLVVMRTIRGRYGHVGLVVADLGAEVEIISGNWRRHVVKTRISRRSVSAFVKT